ncbi:uncharacterized protein LOC115467841 [Microcaecilia unicolor]|uniref:Uncharacterized protein LOC115467841 n=1 Tax=Microcaecilia unicolor TaxID=1415580 RepID=A0A6P7XI82_9AMPH|nr:uncharacterized protein LOC115467841 [Microcaecilia unicolor]
MGTSWAAMVNQEPEFVKPVSFLSGTFSAVEKGLPEIPRQLVALVAAIEKWRAVMPYSPIILHTNHTIYHMLSQSQAALTSTRYGKYQAVLIGQDIDTKPMTKEQNKQMDLVFQMEIEVEKQIEKLFDIPSLQLLTFSPLPKEEGDHWFTDTAQIGSKTSFAALKTILYAVDIKVEKKVQYKAPEGTSAQEAELMGVCMALKETEKTRSCTIYTDSAYVVSSLQYHLLKWKRRGFLTANGKPLQHSQTWQQVLQILSEREGYGTRTAIVWVAAHTGQDTMEARGNELADKAAKEVLQNKILIQTRSREHMRCDTPYPPDPGQIRVKPTEQERIQWENLECKMDTGKTKWIHPNGKICMTTSELINNFYNWHVTLHLSASDMSKAMETIFWHPRILAYATRIVLNCMVCSKNIVHRGPVISPGSIPIPSGPGVEWHLDFTDMVIPVKDKSRSESFKEKLHTQDLKRSNLRWTI